VRNLRLLLSYDGADFAGWQVQPGRATVQGSLASAIGRLTGENVLPQSSGRTDAGVHALAQVATFATESPIPPENWLNALNGILPASIRVLEVTEAAPEFHARKSARAKTYRYRIHRAAICPPFLARYVWHYPIHWRNLRWLRPRRGRRKHDFTSFAAVDPERWNEWRTRKPSHQQRPKIFSSNWAREGEELIYTVRGSGFLHHMCGTWLAHFCRSGRNREPGRFARHP